MKVLGKKKAKGEKGEPGREVEAKKVDGKRRAPPRRSQGFKRRKKKKKKKKKKFS